MPVAVPVLLMLPRSTSAWVVVYVAVQVSDLPGSNVVLGQVTADRPDMGSVTLTALRDWPVLTALLVTR